MQETREQQSLYRFFQAVIYFTLIFEFAVFIYINAPFWGPFKKAVIKFSSLPFYDNLVFSKLATLLIICLVAIGTLAKKNLELNPKTQIVYPLTLGLLLFFGSIFIYAKPSPIIFMGTTGYNILYMVMSLIGTLLIHASMDNISKIIKSGLGKDKWNVEGESFMQHTEKKVNPHSVNIPMQFYFKKKIHDGWINVENPYRGTMVIGTPGSGKSFSIVNPFIRQLLAKEFTMCVYDFKFPDLGKIAYYHYNLAKQNGKMKKYKFHVINLNDVEKSERINPLRADYIRTLADASETAEALVEALKKGDKASGSDAFFTQSAVNFLASCIYFLSRFENGKYSSLPHVLALLNRSYEEIFTLLFGNKELVSLLSPFMTAYKAKAFDQLEGQVGTLKIFISRLASKETFWVFSGNDFNLKISDKEEPGVIVLANDPNTQNINSACYSVVLNRLTRLVNSKDNLPTALIIDEIPTLFVHKIENLIATARSNKVAILMGLQELPQFKQQYGKDTATTITSVVGNIISGSVRNKETLDWLERLFGKSKQMGQSLTIDREKTSSQLSEKLEILIPAGKIASLNSGEVVGMIAADASNKFTGQFDTSAINCKVNLNSKSLKQEEDNLLELPNYYNFGSKKDQILQRNFEDINEQIEFLVSGYATA